MPQPSSAPHDGRMNRAPNPAARVTATTVISVERDLLVHPGDLRGWTRRPARLRGRTADRLAWMGESFVETLRLHPRGVAMVHEARDAGRTVVLESEAFEPVVRPLAARLGASVVRCRAYEMRDGKATGRVLPDPVEFTVTREGASPQGALFLAGEPAPSFSVVESLAGKHLLVTGASGFIGKVWLRLLLLNIEPAPRITLLLRPRADRTGAERLQAMFRSEILSDVVDRIDHVDVVEGDLSAPDLGIGSAERAELLRSVDLVMNCAGLTEFNPDPRDALAVNVDGPLRLLELAREAGVGLLHVSTCFVAGVKEGRIAEEVTPHTSPNGTQYDPVAEREALTELVRTAKPGGTRRRMLIEAARKRAVELGWPNVYTFTKGLGESLLALRAGDVPLSIGRPSIVETAIRSPRGWNEGINTSAPLAHLLGTPFRQLPVNGRKSLDVIPVDLVVQGLTVLAAALLRGCAPPVAQLATSATNPLPLNRAVELTALAHRRHYFAERSWRAWLLAQLEAVPVSRERYQRLSAPKQLEWVRKVNEFSGKMMPGKRAPFGRTEKTLKRACELIELYEPFLLDHEPVFEADAIAKLVAALPADEQETFAWDPHKIDWYDYWVHVHVPALRRWAYPLMEKPPRQKQKPPRSPRAPRRTLVAAEKEQR